MHKSGSKELKTIVALVLVGLCLAVPAVLLLFTSGFPADETFPTDRRSQTRNVESDPAGSPDGNEGAPDSGRDDPEAAIPDVDERSLSDRTCLFTGNVLDGAAGEPVGDFTITICRRDRRYENTRWLPVGMTEAFEDPQGRFELRRDPGEGVQLVKLRVASPGYRTRLSESIRSLRGGAAEEIRVALEPLPAIEGQILDARSDDPVAGAIVYSATDAGWEARFDLDLERVRQVGSDGDGLYRLPVSSDGEHTIVVRHSAYREAVHSGVVPGASRDVALATGFRIGGLAVGSDGAPLSGGTLRIAGTRDGGLPRLEHDIVADEAGRFASSPLRPGQYNLRIAGAGGAAGEHSVSFERYVRLDDRDMLDLKIGGTATRGILRGRLMRGDGPLEGVTVRVSNGAFSSDEYSLRRSKGWKELALRTDEEGRFTLFEIQPGHCSIRFSVDGLELEAAPDRFRVLPGSDRTQVFRVPGGSFEATLADGDTLRPIEGPDSSCFVDDCLVTVSEDGRFTIPFAGSGKKRCTVGAAGYAFRTVALSVPGSGPRVESIALHPGGRAVLSVMADRFFDVRDLQVHMDGWLFAFQAAALKRDGAGRFILDGVDRAPGLVRCTLGNMTQERRIDLTDTDRAEVRFEFSYDGPVRVRGTVVSGPSHADGGTVTFERLREWGEWGSHDPDENMFPTTLDAHGCYGRELPRPGRYRVSFRNEDGRSVPLMIEGDTDWWREIRIEGDSTTVDLEVGTLILKGSLVNALDGKPVEGAHLQLDNGHSALSNTRGRFAFADMASTPEELCVCAAGFHRARFRLDPDSLGESGELKLALGENGGSLRLKVVGDLDSLGRLNRLSFHVDDEHFFFQDLLWIEEDTFLFHGIPPGRRTIRIGDEESPLEGHYHFTSVVILQGKLVEGVLSLDRAGRRR